MSRHLQQIIVYLSISFMCSTPIFAADSPLLQIVSPTDGQTIIGDQVTLSFVLGNVSFGSEAHIHVWMDETPHDISHATEITSHADHVISGLSQGEHTIFFEAVHPDHTSFSPPVVASSRFVTDQAHTLPSISSQRDNNPPPSSLSQRQIVGAMLAIILLISGIVAYLTLA